MTRVANNQALPDVTRDKIIESAGEVFAEVGFHNATIRDICSRAGANVAAVNYHFRDKLGLYTEVLASCLVTQQAAALNGKSAHPQDPKEALKKLICGWFERNHASGRPAWLARIMAHEMANPTPALDRVTESMGTNYLRFRAIVGKLIGLSPDDSRTRLCVHSIVGQILHYSQARPTLERLWRDLNLDDPEWRRTIADHIVEFSLGAMEQIAKRGRIDPLPSQCIEQHDMAQRSSQQTALPNLTGFSSSSATVHR
jgi:AcrR family transcriptional regulator